MQKPKSETPTTAITVKEDISKMGPRELAQSNYMLEQITNALPESSQFSAKNFLRSALTAINKNPRLAECTSASFASCALQVAQVGLLPDGRHAHLIPRNNKKKGVVECNYQLDYKGIVQLIYRSGQVSFIHADTVCENDTFNYSLGEVKSHDIDFKRPRGNPYAAYALAKMKDGSTAVTVMGWDEIMGIAQRSDSVRSAKEYGTKSVWDTDPGEMAKKTVIKRLSKLLPLSYEATVAIDADSRAEFAGIDGDIKPAERPASTAAVNERLKGKRKTETETIIEGEFNNDDGDNNEPAKGNNNEQQAANDSDL